MKNFLMVILIAAALGLSGCADAVAALDALTTPGVVQAAGLMPVMAASATAQPSPTIYQTPTPDILAMAEATRVQLDIELAQVRNTAESARYTATAIVNEVNATRAASVECTETQQYYGRETATQQAIVVRETSVSYSATQSVFMTATVQAPITQQQQVIADWMPLFMGTAWVVGIGLALMLAWAIAWLANAQWAKIQDERRLMHEGEEADPDEWVQPVVHQFQQGTIQVFERNAPLTEKEKEIIARAIANGAKLTFRQMTPDHFSDPRWREIRVKLSEKGPDGSCYATVEQDGTLTLTPTGYQYLGITPPPEA